MIFWITNRCCSVRYNSKNFLLQLIHLLLILYFFPGGDIGKLAVAGTVNDVAVSGAKPKYLSAGFIIEEGFPFPIWKRL